MRQTTTSIALAILVCLCLPFMAPAQEKYSQVKIYAPEDRHARASLLGMLEIDHFVTARDGAIVSEISQSALARLESTGLKHTVLIPDMARHLDSVNQIYYKAIAENPQNKVAFEQSGSVINAIIKTPADFEVKPTFGGYYSFAEMEAAMDDLVANYPGLASKTSIGTTAQGRNIWVIKISDNVATDEANEPELLFMGLQHAREAITGVSMIFFMQYLCEQYSLDSRIQNLVNNREFYIIPCFNPDGWEYNRTSMGGAAGGGWRKNRRPNGGSSYGVDLNRNWGVDWANCSAPISGPSSSCGSGTSTSETYWGPSAFSEAETQAVRNFTKSKHIVIGFDQHAYGPYYSLPFGRQALHTMPQKGVEFYTAIPALMGKYNGMRAADSYDALGYEVAGGFKDWMLMGEIGTGVSGGLKDTVWAMTGEGGAGGGTGGSYGSFWAPASQIINLCKGMTYQNLQLAYAAGTYVDLQDLSDIALTGFETKLKFSIKRLGLGNDPVTVTLVPLENIADVGDPKVISSMPYYGTHTDSIDFALPAGLANGQRIKFAWRIDAGGYTYSDTIVKFLNPTQLFYDDMEGVFGTNWTNTASGTPASGFGYNYTAGSWVFTTSGGYNSAKALSESAAGTHYGTRALRIAQCNTILNLSDATSAHITFWVRHKSENFRDKLQVQVSTNGTTWTAIAGKTTVQEPGTLDDATINGQPALTGILDYWTQEVFDLTNYLGQPAVRFRFHFTSDDDPSTFTMDTDDGFYIDNVKAVKTTAPLVILPVTFVSFKGRLQADQTVRLDWTAITDNEHDHFEVERSSDGLHFTNLGLGPNSEPYFFIDAQPNEGNNFYRIKQLDQNGAVSYSRVINVPLQAKRILHIYPNPVNDLLFIKLNNRQPEKLLIEMNDAQGRTVYHSQATVGSANSELRIDMRSWAPQVYVLKVTSSKGEVLATEKVIKL